MAPLPFVAAAERGAAGGGRGQGRATVPFRQAREVMDAYERKRLTGEEARWLLGRPARMALSEAMLDAIP